MNYNTFTERMPIGCIQYHLGRLIQLEFLGHREEASAADAVIAAPTFIKQKAARNVAARSLQWQVSALSDCDPMRMKLQPSAAKASSHIRKTWESILSKPNDHFLPLEVYRTL